MTEYPMRVLPIEKATEDIITAVGFVATRFTGVEIVTQNLLTALADAQEQVGIALAAHIGDRTAMHIILSIARIRDLPKETLAAVELFASHHHQCRENRNLVVHNRYLPSEDGIEPKIVVLQRITARGNIRVINYAIDAHTIYGVADECLKLASHGQMVVRHINRLRSGRELTPLPPALPVPTDLSKSLCRVQQSEFAKPRKEGHGWTAWNEGSGPQD
jgi:hypothetical protein